MRRDEPLPADFRTANRRPIMSAVGRAELVAWLLVGIATLYVLPAARQWIHAQAEAVQTSALGECNPPAEFEQLHVVVVNRAGRLVAGGCLYVGSSGTYSR